MRYLTNPTENIWMDINKWLSTQCDWNSVLQRLGKELTWPLARYAKVIETVSHRLKVVDTASRREKTIVLFSRVRIDQLNPVELVFFVQNKNIMNIKRVTHLSNTIF